MSKVRNYALEMHNKGSAYLPVMPSSSTDVRLLWIAGDEAGDNQSRCRKASTLSEGLNRSEAASAGASLLSARCFVSKSASM